MPFVAKRKPEQPVFFHWKELWLAMAWAGVLGQQNQAKARWHVQQFQRFATESARGLR